MTLSTNGMGISRLETSGEDAAIENLIEEIHEPDPGGRGSGPG